MVEFPFAFNAAAKTNTKVQSFLKMGPATHWKSGSSLFALFDIWMVGIQLSIRNNYNWSLIKECIEWIIWGPWHQKQLLKWCKRNCITRFVATTFPNPRYLFLALKSSYRHSTQGMLTNQWHPARQFGWKILKYALHICWVLINYIVLIPPYNYLGELMAFIARSLQIQTHWKSGSSLSPCWIFE